MSKRLSLALAICLVLAMSGCNLWDKTKQLPGKAAGGVADAFNAMIDAAEKGCAWRRIKVVENAEFDIDDDQPGAMDRWIADHLADEEYVSDTPADLKAALGDTLDETCILQEFAPLSFPTRVAVRNDHDECWNNEVMYALAKDGKITFAAEGPGEIVIFSMLSVARDTALTNVRKYVYSITDENGDVIKVPVHTTRVTGMWLRHTTVWAGSECAAYVLHVPQGRHTYTVEYVFSGEGDILFKFLEAQQD